jgi:glutathione S-transferase
MALARTKGQVYTFPVMKLNGSSVGDSTAIIEALENAYPEPALYPSDPADRQRALELEDWFDENLGPAIRVVGWHEIGRDRKTLEQVAADAAPPGMGRAKGAVATFAKSFVNLRYGAGSEERAQKARSDVIAALDRLEAELGDRDYLVGDSFSVADLTAASLFYPLVLPPEGPQIVKQPAPGMLEFKQPLEGRRGYLWVGEMFRRHRNRGGAKAA